MRNLKGFLLSAVLLLGVGEKLQAEETQVALQHAKGERLSTAVGHYARARSMLIAAIREFDAGYKLADPSALLDAEKWRSSMLKRGEELERILDPQPRASVAGVKFDADTRLLGEAKK